MSRFLRDLALFLLVQSLLLAILIHFFYDVRHVSPLSPATVVKHKRLTTAPSPRMILIGGSNLLFGLDSPMIEQQTPYHAVNMGLIGGLRLDYITSEIDAELRPGDLVVMSLEYNTLNAEANSDETQVIMGVAARRPENLKFVTWTQWKRLLDQGAVEYFGVVFRQAFADIIVRDADADVEPVIDEDMNEYGDLTRYHDPSVKPRKQGQQNTLVKIKPESVDANIARMNQFIASCKQRGVQVMFAYPPLPRTHYQRGESLARRFHRMLKAGLNAPVVCTPADMVFDDENFIGLSYHLHGHAVQERTQRLIDAVMRHLKKSASRPDSQPAETEPADSGG